MSDFNHELLEACDIIPAFVPIDLAAGANNGQWVNMKYVSKLLAVLFKAAAGSGVEHPVFTLQQATSNAGAGAKALNFTRARTKIGAIASTPAWTIATQAAASTYTPTSSTSQALIAVEINQTDLDMANGFNFVQLSIPDVGVTAQIGCAFYIAAGLRYAQSVTPSVLS